MGTKKSALTQGTLIDKVHGALKASLAKLDIPEKKKGDYTNLDCLMSGLALFSLKCSSLLKFDQSRAEPILLKNLQTVFEIKNVPCDTQLRDRLDEITPEVCRGAFSKLFALVQRNKHLEKFTFFKDHYLISIDGSGIFESSTVHCSNCCQKNHRNGTTSYYHQMVSAALVHPDQKTVYPFPPEPIMQQDGTQKNDCERNAIKRWLSYFRKEHPHLKAVILADGLSSNAPFIEILREKKLKFILVCNESDHKFLTEQVARPDPNGMRSCEKTHKGIKRVYSYMNNVSINKDNPECRVNVVRFSETKIHPKTKKSTTTRWMWVTDLSVNLDNIEEFVKGARARWKIENETFNTLKNQGYQFEHNFGHGKKHLTSVFASLMFLAFFIDQCMQHLNVRFQDALKKFGSKKGLWEQVLAAFYIFEIPDFDSLYHFITHPPPIYVPAVA